MRQPIAKKLWTNQWGYDIWSIVRPKRYPIFPAGGGGIHFPGALKSIRLSRFGCSNRGFYHITVFMHRRHQHDHCIEQLGTFDPVPNMYNEKVCSINIERLRYWLAHRSYVTPAVGSLLGMAGILPMHPRVYQHAWKNRKYLLELLKNQVEEEEKEKETEEAASA